MTAHPFAAIVLVLSAVVALLCALRLLQRLASPTPECTRKLMHLGSGFIALSLPWLFDRIAPVMLLGALLLIGLLALRHVAALQGLHSVIGNVDRRSIGELCIPVAVGFLFIGYDGDLLIYTLPLLAMTLADSAAALVGSRIGRISLRSGKTLEGSFAFFAVAILTSYVALLTWADCSAAHAMLLALLLALLLTAIEAASVYGLDNLFVPVGGFFILRLFGHMQTTQLAVEIVLTLLVLALSFYAQSRPVLRGRLTH